MKLGTEFQGRSYDMMISHTPLVYCIYFLLEWLKRQENDPETFGELFLMYCDAIQDMECSTALQSLMGLFIEQLNQSTHLKPETIKNQLRQ